MSQLDKSPLVKSWLRASQQFAARPVRERALALITAVAAGALLCDHFLLHPRDLELRTLRLREGALKASAIPTPVADRSTATLVQRRHELEQQIAQADAVLAALEVDLVPSNAMKSLLDQLLVEVPGVRMTRMHELPASAIDAGAPAAQDSGATLHRHGFEVTLQGSYPELLRYLERIEALPQRVLWRQVELDARDYPTEHLNLVIYTLSKEATWLVL